ncbi:hypothetical protein HNR08_001360 [Cellulomonas hominis]|uniref:Permease n=1 Tax=Cellulomonas hominis TaxID=156981 RepID=A0A7W8W9I8_9CELL|nr:hypothetical protein [Cellulomonas hominis]MBB5472624.1 hypothetical protein [Cellulomonas hominis]
MTTAVLATLVAVAGVLGDVSLAGRDGVVLAALLAVLAVVFALGLPRVAALPARIGSSVVIGLAGVAAVVVAHLTASEPLLGDVPVVFALSVLAAFVAELARRDGRERLVESVAGTVAGALVAVCAAGWLAAERTAAGDAVVVTGAVALAVGSALTALPLRGWAAAGAALGASTAAGLVAGAALPAVGLLPGGLLGFGVGVLVAAADALFDRLPALEHRLAGWAVAVLPVAVTGILVYVVGRVLVG